MKTAKSIFLPFFFIGMSLMMNLDICCEFQKIPDLLAHFAEHKATDGDSFWQFIIEDFIDQEAGENHHNDNNKDDLPFHGNHQCQHSTVLFSTDVSFSIEPHTNDSQISEGYYQFRFSSFYLEAPLQPPQG